MPRQSNLSSDTRMQIDLLCVSMARHVGRAETTVIRWASGSGDTLKRLRGGKPFTDVRMVKIIQWFSDHWPNDLEWPGKFPRPKPIKEPRR